MISLLLALAVPQPAPEAAVLRDGRRLEGRVLEFGQIVEVEHADGKRTRVYGWEVARVEPGGDYPRCPEVFPFPPDLLEKIDYDYASYRRILVAVPRVAGKKIMAVDAAAAKRLWELEVPDLLVPPVVAGSAIYFVQGTKELDESRKLKFGGSAMAKEVHRITVKAVDLETCETRWSHTFDNNDRRDVFWTVASNPAPTLHFLPDRVALRIAKDAWPVDSQGNCDKTRPQKYATFVFYDPAQKRLVGTVDSPDAAEAGGRPWFTPDLVVLQVYTTSVSWRLVAVGVRDGKKKWETESVTGVLHEVGDEWAYMSDLTQFYAVSLKTGKRLERWTHELNGGQVADLHDGTAYLYRNKRAPKQIEAIDLKKGAVAWKIPVPEDDEYAHLRIVGTRLLFTDRVNRIHAFDLPSRKEAWVWQGAGPSFLQSAAMLGSALGFYKDGRITLLDPAGGQKIWEVKGAYRTVVPIGDEGYLAIKNPGADLVRRRRFDRPGVFLTPGDIPLRYAWGGDEAWSAPVVADGVAYAVASGPLGTVALAVDLKERKVAWTERLSRTPAPLLASPVVHDGVYAANVSGEIQAWALSNKGRIYAARHQAFAPEKPFAELDGAWFACSPSVPFSAVEFATGRRLWDSAARSVVAYALAGDTLHAASATQYHRVDPKTGAVRESSPVARGVTNVAADATRVYLVSGPYGFGTPGPEGIKPRWTAKATDPKIALRFRGAFALTPDGAVYSHADGAVAFWKEGADKPEWTITTPFFTSPLLVHEGRVWFAAAGLGLVGADLKEGRFAWKSAVADAASFTPMLWEGRPAFWSADGWLIPVKEE